jgi:hypothetical protein
LATLYDCTRPDVPQHAVQAHHGPQPRRAPC